MICHCGTQIEPGRLRLGITTCMPCGEKHAAKEREAKSRRVALAYPKGPYMYAGANEDAKRNLLDSTDRRRATEAQEIFPVRVARELNRKPSAAKPKAIGVYWLSGDKNGTFYFDENDPNLKRATRKMRFDGA